MSFLLIDLQGVQFYILLPDCFTFQIYRFYVNHLTYHTYKKHHFKIEQFENVDNKSKVFRQFKEGSF